MDTGRVAAMLLALVMAQYAAGVNYCHYNAAGSGSWADKTRWENENVPQTGDVVRIGTAALPQAATATDADREVVQRVGQFRLYGSSTLTLEFDQDVELGGTISGDLGSRIVKSGAGRLVMKGSYGISPEVVVNQGVVQVSPPDMDCSECAVFTANGSGSLVVDAQYDNDSQKRRFKFRGLRGDGLVSSVDDEMLSMECMGDSESNPNVFSGTFGASNVEFCVRGGVQHLPCTMASWNFIPKLYSGCIGLPSDALYSSSATGNHVIQFQGTAGEPEAAVLCLGGHVECNRTMTFYGRVPSRIDGGDVGGITFSGKWTMKEVMNDVILDGSNSEACVLSNAISEFDGYGASITKRGSGVWRLADNAERNNAGLVSVERGVLEYESIADCGTVCSLGRATRLYEPHCGTIVPSKAVTYAIRIGDGTSDASSEELATFTYVGSDAAAAARPIAISGAGRITNSGNAALRLRGVTSAGSGTNTLVLAGQGASNSLEDITNGVGVISILKEGCGRWTIGRNLDIGGDIVLRGGTLEIDNAASSGYDTMSAVGLIEVSSNATLVAHDPLLVDRVRCDVAAGGGIVDGFAFSSSGTLEIVADGGSISRLPVRFRNATGLANLESWTLVVDGQVDTRKAIMTLGDMVIINPPGLMMLVR